ncbi:hypothetical protein BGZ51_009813 [Haplosporangium sp. Z 767]|nr:hypothetical protein BGZ51_009813 [Haplosporangium sp. Z 767]
MNDSTHAAALLAPTSIKSPSHRVSVLDPMLDAARRSFRSPSGRIIGVSTPITPLPPAPTVADFPRPPPPPTKVISGPLTSKMIFPLPPGPPPPHSPATATFSLSSPPSSPQVPTITPKDKRRSPQSSVIMTGIIQPPPTPPSRSRASSRSLPTPPSSSAIMVNHGSNAQFSTIAEDIMAQENMHESSGRNGKGSDVETTLNHVIHKDHAEALSSARVVEDDDEKVGLESHDEFEDAEEELVYRAAEEVNKARESRREQSERASRLMGEKMLQGWAMLQEACPNEGCNGVPLMRSREKKEFCVVCENYFQREQDLQHGKHTLVPLDSSTTIMKTTAQFPAPPTNMPPIPRAVSPKYRITSPLSSPSQSRTVRDLNGRISSSIVLPPTTPMSPSFGMTSQQILNRHLSDDMDKLASEDEETRKHLQMIGRVNEYSARSLPPVPPVPQGYSSSSSRPTSTYSSSSEKERTHYSYHGHSAHYNTPTTAHPPAPAPLSPEVQAIVNATHKTISTLIVKLEHYRHALEESESPKECQALANQIKGIMECLKSCRDVL